MFGIDLSEFENKNPDYYDHWEDFELNERRTYYDEDYWNAEFEKDRG